ncbi:MAG TPA: hypothetical protein VI565_05745, partial [Burkholderiales bacterium]|nr:hypothetical protein [Burkholderiales bacterium]
LCDASNTRKVGSSVINPKYPATQQFWNRLYTLATAQGKGWIDYDWKNPVTGKTEPKSTYIERVGEVIVGCGIYRGEKARPREQGSLPGPHRRAVPALR